MDSRNGTFSIKDLYFVLELGRSIPFLMGVIWNSMVSFEASFFAWKASWGRVDFKFASKEMMLVAKWMLSL